MLYPDAGAGRGISQTYQEAVEKRVTTNHNILNRILKPFAKDKAQLQRIVTPIQNPMQNKGRSPVEQAAMQIGRMLTEERNYMIEAGVEVGEVEGGYFPRQYDFMKVLQNEAGFVRAAARAYKATYGREINDKQAAEMAESWLENMKLGDAGVKLKGNDFAQVGSGQPSVNNLKPRTLSKEADSIMKDFTLQDPAEVLSSHFLKTAQKAEFNKRFGGENWQTLKSGMLKEGAGAAIGDVVKVIQSATGNMPSNIGAKRRSALSWAKTYGALRFLDHATITSLSEIAMPAIQTGDVSYFGKAFTDGFKILTRSYDMKDTLEISEEVLGTMAQAASDQAVQQRMGGLVESRLPRHIQQKYFSRIGLHQFTEMTGGIATNAGRSYLSRLAKDMSNPKMQESSKYFLADLGIPKDVAPQFAQWLLQHEGGQPNASQLRGNDQMTEMYNTALGRFVDQTRMKPKSSERPRYAQHPVGSLFYYLQSFIYGFSKNVMIRNGRLAKEAVTGKGLTMQDRFNLAKPALLLPALYMTQLALGELRDELFKDPARKERKPKGDLEALMMSKHMKAASRSGYFGALDPYINMVYGIKYQRDPLTGASGAIIGDVITNFAAFVRFFAMNSENTNTAERNAAKALYNLAVKPLLVGASSLVPSPVAGVAGIQAMGHPATREAFVSALAGEKGEKTGGSKRGSRKRKTRKRKRRTSR